VIKQLTPFSVPVFLVVSGYFIAFASRAGLSWKMVRMRIRDLLIPYLIWSVVVMALDTVFGTRFSLGQIVVNLLVGNASPVYYYVPLICQLFVLSPFLVPLIRSSNWKKVLAAAGLLQILLMVFQYLCIFGIFSVNINWFFGNLVFFFALGVALNFHLDEIRAWIHRRRFYWLAALGVFALLAVIETEVYFRLELGDYRGGVQTLAATLYTLSFLLVFIEFDRLQFRYAGLLGKIGQKAYGIYLMHPVVLLLAAKTIYHLVPWMLGWQWLFQPVLLLSGIGIPLFAMRVVARSPLRGGYRFLFG
jgi:surface polysaccharide O-acyltransferase-like enzyme